MTVETTNAEPAEVVDVSATEHADLGAAFDRIMVNNGANRDGPTGQFSSPAADAAGTAEDGEGAGDGEAELSTVPAAVPAPANWKGLETAWEAIPADHRDAVAKHFDELHRRDSERGRQLAQVKPIADKLTAAVSQFPQFKGMTPDRIAEGALQLAAVQASLGKDPLGTILQVAQQYNVLPALAEKLTGQKQDVSTSALEAKVADLQRKLEAASDPSKIEAQVSQAYESRAVHDVLNQFASDPANSFFSEVEPQLPAFIQAAQAMAPDASPRDLLKSAYDMAINALPDIRAKVQAAAKTAADKANAVRTEAAKKAASINVKTSSNGKDRHPTEFEALGSAYDRAMAN